MIVFRIYSSQRIPSIVHTIGLEFGQPDRTFRQENRQEQRGKGREYEKYHVDCLPWEQRSDSSGEQYAHRKENAVQRQQHLSVRRVSYFRDVNYDHGSHAYKSETVLLNFFLTSLKSKLYNMLYEDIIYYLKFMAILYMYMLSIRLRNRFFPIHKR